MPTAASSTATPLAMVTGASSGIGLELARQFAQNGFDLIVAAEDAGIEQAAQELQSHGIHAQAVQADLATPDGVEQLIAAMRAAGRPVDAAALNAGVGVGGGDFSQTSLEEELNLINLNIVAVVKLTKFLVRDMKARGVGRILFTSSIAATMPGPFYSVYAASKSFVQSFAEAIRNELDGSGVTVTSLMPGATDTHFFERAHMENTPAGQAKKDDPAEVARDGYEALMRGDDKVVAGSFKNKVQVAMSKPMPDTAKAAMHRRQTEPQS